MASNADQHPRDGRQIMDRAQFRNEVGPGFHIAEKRDYKLLSYYHHSLVVEVQDTRVRIIQYGSIRFSVEVHETFLEFDHMDFIKGVYLISSNGYPQSMNEKHEAIRRARTRIGEDKYMVAINNCEHFVTWALTGAPSSHQIRGVKRKMADAVDACFNKKSKISPLVGPSILAFEEAGKAVVEAADIKAIQALGENAVDTIGTATAAGNSILRPISTTSVIKVAVSTAIIETAVLALDIRDLNGSRAAGVISEIDFNRGIVTRTSGAFGSFAGGTAGSVCGQVIIPVPFLGGLLGAAFGSGLTSALFSVASGFVFDNA